MQNRKRMKMCSNCEGMVDLEVIVCPYCGSDISKGPKEEIVEKKTKNFDDTLSSLYPPPYKPGDFDQNIKENTEFSEPEPESSLPTFKSGIESDLTKQKTEKKAKPLDKNKMTLLAALIFSVGMNLSLFSVFLLFFSSNGEIFLRWNTSLWYLYSLLGVGLLTVGYRLLSGFTDKPEEPKEENNSADPI